MRNSTEAAQIFKLKVANKTNRNFGLDAMRTIAVLLVLMHHWLGVYEQKYFRFFSIFGFYGVELFFVLSGFLIGNILIKMYIREPIFNFKMILNFWNRRWMRTVPLYYFVLIVFILIFWAKNIHINELWKYFVFLQNIAGYKDNNHDFYGVSWSLSIEEWFYLSFPVLLLIVSALFKKILGATNVIILVISIFIFTGLFFRIVYSFNIENEWNNIFRKAVIAREDSIAFGVLGALMFNINPQKFKLWRYHFGIAGVILLIFGVIVFVKYVPYSYYRITTVQSTIAKLLTFYSKTFLFSTISIAMLFILPFFYYCTVNNSFVNRGVLFISKISYSLYLIHPFILEQITKWVKGDKNILLLLTNLVLFLLFTIICSFITFKLIEETFLKIRDKFSKEDHKAV